MARDAASTSRFTKDGHSGWITTQSNSVVLDPFHGGTLIQHIPDEINTPLAHEQPNPRDEAGHAVTVTEGTLLHRIAGNTQLSVNSAHHQAAKGVGENVTINSTAPDGVIEGIEASEYAFCLGVQWHPEFSIDPADARIFEAFISAAEAHT